MLLLDPADVPLHLAKICKYSLAENTADFFFCELTSNLPSHQ